ncbi:MAG: NDP-sugar synthase [Chloroflexota bacterium]|nr:NDP-sugar synthase [Chloroflexota bacterium]
MKAVVLVGGEGTRLRPLTCNTVKAMVPVINRPFLEHMISHLCRYNICDVILALGYLPYQIESRIGSGTDLGVNLTYSVEDSPLGTAGAVKNAEQYLDDEPFYVFNGDIFCDIDLGDMLTFHRERGAIATIALTPVDDPSAYGVVETNGTGRVDRFVEKPPKGTATTNLINAGIYILESTLLKDIPSDTPFMFEHHLFPLLLQQGLPVYGYPSDAYWIDMGTPEKYLNLNQDLLNGRAPFFLDNNYVCNEHKTSTIDQSDGPVILGDNCVVGPGAQIVGPAVLGDGCVIGDGAVIERSVLWQNVKVGCRANLVDCIVGSDCLIGDDSRIPQGSVVGDHVVIDDECKIQGDSRIWPGTRIS